MKCSSMRHCTVSLTIVTGLALAAPVQAEESAGAARAPGSETAATAENLILVTAQKRIEELQKVPVSIVALDSSAMTAANVASVQDLGRLAPNVQVNKGVQSSFLRLNIRGIGSASNTTIEPSVAVFIDGIYVPRPGAIVGGMLDMKMVEILRGPQGTLFGRNASAGTLLLNTATPDDDFSARITGEFGTGDRYKLDGYINVPLGEDQGIRLAGMSQWFGGYWKNALDGKQYGGTDDISFRATYKGQFGDLEWIVRGDYSEIKGDGFTNVDFDARSVSGAQLAALRTRLGGQLPDTNPDDRILNQYVTAVLDDEQWGISSTMSYDMSGSTLRFIASYRDWQNDQLDGDAVFTPAPILSRVGSYGSESQNYELQFLSPVREWADGHLDLVAGLYYFAEDYSLSEKFQLSHQYCNVLVGPGPARAACNAYLASTGGLDATDQEVRQTGHSYAAYGQLTWHFTNRLALTLGGRYTRDEKEGSYSQVSGPFTQALRATEILSLPSIRDERFTYRVSLNYEPDGNTMFFANLSTGYKPGGYNSGGGSPSLSTFDAQGNLISTKRVFDRETTTNYELGAKTQWLNGALTANVTLYRMDFEGYQDRAFDGTSFTVLNVGKLRQQGFEFDAMIAPARNFRVTAALAYLDSEFLSYPDAPGLPGSGGTQNLKGKPGTFSPEFSGNVAAGWTCDIGASGMTLDLNANLSWVSDQYYGLVTDANPQTIQDGYFLLGARLTLNGEDNRWSISIFGNNLTGTSYSNGNFYQPLDGSLGLRNGVFPGSTGVRVLRADPRTYGASATFRL